MLVNVKFHNGLINGLRNNWEWVHLVFDHREWLVTSYAFPLVAANWIRCFQTCEFPAGRFAHFRVYGDLKKYFAFSFFNQPFASRMLIYIYIKYRFSLLTWRFSTLLFSFLQIICGAWSLALSACTELHLSFWRLSVYYRNMRWLFTDQSNAQLLTLLLPFAVARDVIGNGTFNDWFRYLPGKYRAFAAPLLHCFLSAKIRN